MVIDLNSLREKSKVTEERAFLSLLAPRGKATIKDLVDEHRDPMPMEPDESYGYGDESLPRLVIEVSYSQQPKNLEKCAWEFLQGSECNIATVIGFDLEYKRSKQASVFVWRGRRSPGDGGVKLGVDCLIDGEVRRPLAKKSRDVAPQH
jgi:hypothetical protein